MDELSGVTARSLLDERPVAGQPRSSRGLSSATACANCKLPPDPPSPTFGDISATVQSWQFRGRSNISKYGNARLLRTLWIAAQAAVLKPANSFRDKFERYIAQGRHNPQLLRQRLCQHRRQKCGGRPS